MPKGVYTDPVKRFEEKVRIDWTTGCHTWTASKNLDGYGRFVLQCPRRTVQAHRFAYEQRFEPIPDGMLACHVCDNPSCVNPDHIFLGTQADNMRDMHSKRRKPRTSPETVQAIRNALRTGEVQRRIAERFGVCPQTVSNIKHLT